VLFCSTQGNDKNGIGIGEVGVSSILAEVREWKQGNAFLANELDLFFYLGRHVPLGFIHILRCPVEEIRINKYRRNAARRHRETRSAGFSHADGRLSHVC
jgi:hypothetical protein